VGGDVRPDGHRDGDGALPELKARLAEDRQTALQEAQRARDTLGGPFKHADALTATANEVKRIQAAMQDHEQPAAQAAAATTPVASQHQPQKRETPDAERAAAVLGPERTARLRRARAALVERFARQQAARWRCNSRSHRRSTGTSDSPRSCRPRAARRATAARCITRATGICDSSLTKRSAARAAPTRRRTCPAQALPMRPRNKRAIRRRTGPETDRKSTASPKLREVES
jgi:hypothetical protein